MNIALYNQFKQSVYDLADKLPQWNTEQYDRKFTAAVSSMFEELGEISGLISKYRTRTDKHGTDFYNTLVKDIPAETLYTIKNKFIDEAGDAIWILTTACHVFANESIGIFSRFIMAKENNIDISLEDALFSTIGSVYVLYTSTKFEDDNIGRCLNDIADAFGLFLVKLEETYGITLDEILIHNMEKLGVRYDNDGKRIDGKL